MKEFNLLVESTTEQELFDHVVRHLATQQVTCMIEGDCQYRVGKLSCAIGACFSDSHYDPAMDAAGSLGASKLIDRFFPTAGHLRDLAGELQNCHDSNIHLNTLKANLEAVARDYRLNDTLINTIESWDGTD